MLLIAHRGNINGPNQDKENRPEYLLEAYNQFHVEADIWYIDNKLYLGHDKPQYNIEIDFLNKIKDKLFCHCKNIDALNYILNSAPDMECFFHDSDECVLTSKNHIWTYPGKKLTVNSICVMPERVNQNPVLCFGVCTDYPSKFKNI
jgi:hypothetical protein